MRDLEVSNSLTSDVSHFPLDPQFVLGRNLDALSALGENDVNVRRPRGDFPAGTLDNHSTTLCYMSSVANREEENMFAD